jgi:hypothetical protein
MEATETIGLVILLLVLPVLAFLTSRVRAGKTGDMRPLPGLEDLSGAIGRAAETGQPLHVSVGVAGVGGTATSETWAGLTVLAELADEAAACDTPLVVTVADPTVLPLAQDILQRAYTRHGNPKGYDPTQVRLIAPNSMAYAAGVMGVVKRESLAANVMIGLFGDEYLLIGETGVQKGIRQVVGTSEPRTLPFVHATADEALTGEDMFAGGAYTARLPIQVGSLLVADWARWAIALVIIVVSVVRILLL